MVDYLLPQIKEEEGKIKPQRSQNIFLKTDRRMVYTSMKVGASAHVSTNTCHLVQDMVGQQGRECT